MNLPSDRKKKNRLPEPELVDFAAALKGAGLPDGLADISVIIP